MKTFVFVYKMLSVTRYIFGFFKARTARGIPTPSSFYSSLMDVARTIKRHQAWQKLVSSFSFKRNPLKNQMINFTGKQ